MATRMSFTHLSIFIFLFAFGNCQFPSSFMSMMGGGGMGSNMMGMSSSMMNPMMSGMNFGSMMPGMMMGNNNDPMMSLVMSSVELGATDFMILNNLVRTIVGPQAFVNAAMLVLYSTDGGLPINAIRMIPYVTLMQGIAKDLKISVPGVSGQASNEQIDQYIFQRALMWMQQRNMAGAFMELPGMGMMLMNNAMGGMNSMQSATPAPTTQKPTTSSADAARAALAKFVAASKAAAAKKKAADAAKSAPAQPAEPAAKPAVPAAPAVPTAPKFDAALFAKIMSGMSANGGSTDQPITPAPMIGYDPHSMSGMSNNMNPAFMAMGIGGMEMMGF